MGIRVVEVESDSIEMALALAGSKEVLQPLLARRSVRAGGRDEAITLVLEGLNILQPKLGAAFGGHIRLTLLVGLVVAENSPGVSFHDGTLELGNLLLAPQHRNTLKPEALGRCGDPRAPGIDGRDFVGLEVGESFVVIDRPGDTNFAYTAIGARVSAAARRRSARRGSSAVIIMRRGGSRGRGLCGTGCGQRRRDGWLDNGRGCGPGLAALAVEAAFSLGQGSMWLDGRTSEVVGAHSESVGRGGTIGASKNYERGKREDVEEFGDGHRIVVS